MSESGEFFMMSSESEPVAYIAKNVTYAPPPKTKTPQHEAEAFCHINPGDDLLSHAVTRAVPWALEGLTTVFGMGTGVTPPVKSPENLQKQ